MPLSWIQADAHPYNLLSDGGRFAGILDWADIAGGDPATDLGFLWLSLPAAGVAAALDAHGASDATAARAHGTGLAMAAGWTVRDEGTREIGWRALTALGVVVRAVPAGP